MKGIHTLTLTLLLLLGGCVHKPMPVDTDATPPIDSQLRVNHEKAARLNAELGIAYLDQGQVTRAKSKLLHARELAPHLSLVHYSLAYYFERIGENEAAEQAYKKSLSLEPFGGEENNNYGTFLCRQGRYEDAEKYFIVAIDDLEYLDTSSALENAGLCLLEVPDSAGASAYFERAIRQDPRRTGPWLELAALALKEGKVENAQFYYGRYHELSKESSPRGLFIRRSLAQYEGDDNAQASAELMLRSQFPYAVETIELNKGD